MGTVTVRIAFTVLVTASVLALLVIAVPALRDSPRAGVVLAAGIGIVCFGVITALLPSRRR